jgi:hypothetical protein
MTKPFTFTWHRTDSVLEFKLVGLFTADDIRDFGNALRTELKRCPTYALADCTEWPAQHPDVAAVTQGLMAEAKKVVSFTMNVTGSGIATMQLRRLFRESGTESTMGCATTADEAWATLRAMNAAA